MTAQEIMKEIDGIIAVPAVILGEDEGVLKCFGEWKKTKRCLACVSEDECKEKRDANMKAANDEVIAKCGTEFTDKSIDEIEALVSAELATEPVALVEVIAEPVAAKKEKKEKAVKVKAAKVESAEETTVMQRLIKGYSGLNTPEMMTAIFEGMIAAKPTTKKEAKALMVAAIVDNGQECKSVPTRFSDKVVDKLANEGLVVDAGKDLITWA